MILPDISALADSSEPTVPQSQQLRRAICASLEALDWCRYHRGTAALAPARSYFAVRGAAVHFTSSGTKAFHLACRISSAAGATTAILPSPSWPGSADVCRGLGMDVKLYDAFTSPDARILLPPAMLLGVDPDNPSGFYRGPDHWIALYTTARDCQLVIDITYLTYIAPTAIRSFITRLSDAQWSGHLCLSIGKGWAVLAFGGGAIIHINCVCFRNIDLIADLEKAERELTGAQVVVLSHLFGPEGLRSQSERTVRTRELVYKTQAALEEAFPLVAWSPGPTFVTGRSLSEHALTLALDRLAMAGTRHRSIRRHNLIRVEAGPETAAAVAEGSHPGLPAQWRKES